VDGELAVAAGNTRQLVAIDDALTALEAWDARKARVVEFRFFGGLNVEETAEILHVSPDTVVRDWKLAKVWLQREMKKSEAR
jgi:RNA polymerase sigma-70 factor, ECF subfamily